METLGKSLPVPSRNWSRSNFLMKRGRYLLKSAVKCSGDIWRNSCALKRVLLAVLIGKCMSHKTNLWKGPSERRDSGFNSRLQRLKSLLRQHHLMFFLSKKQYCITQGWGIQTFEGFKKNGILEPFVYKTDHFAKTGSGQT